MPATIDGYHSKLINKILFANSPHEVQTFIYAAIKGLNEHKVHNYIIKRFLDKTVENLKDFNQGDYDYNAQQWNNIKTSKIVINRIKASISKAVN